MTASAAETIDALINSLEDLWRQDLKDNITVLPFIRDIRCRLLLLFLPSFLPSFIPLTLNTLLPCFL